MQEEYDDDPIQFQKQIKIYLNGDTTKFIDFRLAQNSLWSDIQYQLERKFSNFQTLKLFTQQGVEILSDDLMYIKDGYSLYASRGEDFDPYSPFSQYQIIKRLGEGGFGRVELAQHRDTKEVVAIKIIKYMGNASDIDLLFREAEILKSLDHRNIVKVYNSYIIKNMQMAVVMEYLEGGELAERLKWKGNFQEEETFRYLKQIVSAIAYCHSKKLIHRDLKLENILFVNKNSDELKAIDFGIAGMQTVSNTDNVNIGSLYYMAPEILSGRQTKVNQSIDIWAIGVILYQMLFGVLPFTGKSRNDIINAIVGQNYQIPRNDLSQEVIHLISLLLDKNDESRIHINEIEQHPWMMGQRTPQVKKKQLSVPKRDRVANSASPRTSGKILSQQQKPSVSKFK